MHLNCIILNAVVATITLSMLLQSGRDWRMLFFIDRWGMHINELISLQVTKCTIGSIISFPRQSTMEHWLSVYQLHTSFLVPYQYLQHRWLLSVIQFTWAFMSTITSELTAMRRLNFNQVDTLKAANSNSDFAMLIGTLMKMSLS